MPTGLLIPFQRDQAQDFARVDGARLRDAKVRQVLGTSPGELPWRTSFGAGLDLLRHRSNDVVTAELGRVRARDGLQTWIRDVAVTAVDVERDDTQINFRVHFTEALDGKGEVVV